MLNAQEAFKIAEANDQVKVALERIDQEIHERALLGEMSLWWRCGNLSDNQILTLGDRLRKEGYWLEVYLKRRKIYVSWRKK